MDFSFLLYGTLIVFVSFALKAVTGMGAALLCVPLLAMLIDIKAAVPLELLFEIVFGAVLVTQVYRQIQKEMMLVVVLSAFAGIFTGAGILLYASETALRVVLSLVVFVFSLRIFFTLEKSGEGEGKRRYIPGLLCGFAGGSIGGITGQQGPPIALYLEDQIKDKTKLRATLIAVFFINDVFRMIVYLTRGILRTEMFIQSLYFLPALIIAIIVGNFFHFRIEDSIFRKLIALILIASALIIAYPVIVSLL